MDGLIRYFVEIDFLTSKSAKVITPIPMEMVLDGRSDEGAFSILYDTNYSKGETTVSTYQSREFGNYRRLECTVYYKNISFEAESMYYFFDSVGDKIVIPIVGYFS